MKHVNLNDENHKQALNAQSILGQLDQIFVFCTLLFSDILKETKGVSDLLQTASMEYIKAADMIVALIEELEMYRFSVKANDYYKLSSEIASKNVLNIS